MIWCFSENKTILCCPSSFITIASSMPFEIWNNCKSIFFYFLLTYCVSAMCNELGGRKKLNYVSRWSRIMYTKISTWGHNDASESWPTTPSKAEFVFHWINKYINTFEYVTKLIRNYVGWPTESVNHFIFIIHVYQIQTKHTYSFPPSKRFSFFLTFAESEEMRDCNFSPATTLRSLLNQNGIWKRIFHEADDKCITSTLHEYRIAWWRKSFS